MKIFFFDNAKFTKLAKKMCNQNNIFLNAWNSGGSYPQGLFRKKWGKFRN